MMMVVAVVLVVVGVELLRFVDMMGGDE